MNNNSIVKEIKPESLTAYVRIEIASNKQSKKMLIIVEGNPDKILFEDLYPKEYFYVIFCEKYPGCQQFEDLCSDLRTFYNKFIVIKDADFDNLNGVTYPFCNLFLTDFHDIEIMMLTTNFYNAVSVRFHVDNVPSLIDEAMKEIVHLSYIKWMNNVDNMGIGFDYIKVGNRYQGTTCVNIEDWIDYIKNTDDNKIRPSISSLTLGAVQDFENKRPMTGNNLLQLTNGHDLIGAIERKINRITKQNVGKQKIKDLLFHSYTINEYRKTSLYNNIAIWFRTIGFISETG